MEAQDHLFRRIDGQGNYTPHQAIYGFSPQRVLQYCEAYLLLSLLDKLDFGNFIDIGCAEGFYPRLVNARYGAETYGVDLSISGVRRMRDYHKLDGVSADAHFLPIGDNSFDVALCSNTVEHVSNPDQVIAELMRIARKYVIVGVPQALTQKEIDNFRPDLEAQRDQHVQIYTISTFREILPESYPTTIHHACSLAVLILNAIYKRTVGRMGHCLPLVKALLRIDRLTCRLSPRRTLHMLALIDLTGDDPASTQKKRPGIADFILKGIYELNKQELDSIELSLGSGDTKEWREYTVKKFEESSSDEMPVSDKILAFLVCPQCKSKVVQEDGILVCQSCEDEYAVEDGIPIMHHLYNKEEAKD